MRWFSLMITLAVILLDRDFRLRESFADALNTTKRNNDQQRKSLQVKVSIPAVSPPLKSSRHKKRARSRHHDFKCMLRNEGQLRYFSGKIQVCKSRLWTAIDRIRALPKRSKLPVSCLDAKFRGLDKGKGNGHYWINPSGVNDLRNSFLAYCDMTTAGGGWLLVAKVTHDFAWICPERKGASCLTSNVDPVKANLFHPVHERDFVDLTISEDENSGIHLKISKIRKQFESGQQSVRFTFVTADTGWKPSEDAYAAFNRQRPNALFVDRQWVAYSSDKQDYTWNVITHQRKGFKFTGSTLCWGSNVGVSYRFYEHGLHAGSASSGNKKCHLANDETEIMLKSHYAIFDSMGNGARWDPAQFGFLNSHLLQVPCKRIAIWVR